MVRGSSVSPLRRDEAGSVVTCPYLPLSFYDRSDALRRIRKAAFARMIAPDALLAVCLCRVAASVPPGITLPPPLGGTVDYVAAIIGAPGTGKSLTFDAASDLIPDIGTVLDGVPIGSGEGIAAAYVGKPDETNRNPIVNTSALFYVDEGESLLTVARREGSTTMATIRSAWAGREIGAMNATAERRRIVKAKSYRFAMAVGLQPTFAATLLHGAKAGDPQRFLFASVTNPELDDVTYLFPEPITLELTGTQSVARFTVDPVIVDAIRSRRLRVSRGVEIPDPLDSHKSLLTMKTAALLSILEGDHDLAITGDRWNAAVAIVENSRNVRAYLADQARVDHAERITEQAENDANRQFTREEALREKRVRACAATMTRKAKKEARKMTQRELGQAIAGKHRGNDRGMVDDAIAYAVEHGTEDGRLRRVLSDNGKTPYWEWASD